MGFIIHTEMKYRVIESDGKFYPQRSQDGKDWSFITKIGTDRTTVQFCSNKYVSDGGSTDSLEEAIDVIKEYDDWRNWIDDLQSPNPAIIHEVNI